jgi:hypothetical protein
MSRKERKEKRQHKHFRLRELCNPSANSAVACSLKIYFLSSIFVVSAALTTLFLGAAFATTAVLGVQ